VERSTTLNDVARLYLKGRYLPPSGRGRVLRSLARCRTEALGGTVYRCDHCPALHYEWNPCNNRHCPSCLRGEAEEWVQAQKEHLLPVPYFHVVFTLPRPVADLALYNKKRLYDLLMRVSAETLKTIAADKKFLNGEIGFTSVLHTWSQRLEHHPHVHMLVPGGALSHDKERWQAAQPHFFLPVKVLSRLFRRRFVEELDRLRREGALRFQGAAAQLDDQWSTVLLDLRRQEWVVYAKPPFGGPEQVIGYLARYTHRVAISNSRILHADADAVTFRFRKSIEPYEQATLTLPLKTFVDRFCLHILPKGFTRIRHYGFLAPAFRKAKIELIRRMLGVREPAERQDPGDASADVEDEPPRTCPVCGEGHLHRLFELPRPRQTPSRRSRLPLKATAGPPPRPWLPDARSRAAA